MIHHRLYSTRPAMQAALWQFESHPSSIGKPPIEVDAVCACLVRSYRTVARRNGRKFDPFCALIVTRRPRIAERRESFGVQNSWVLHRACGSPGGRAKSKLRWRTAFGAARTESPFAKLYARRARNRCRSARGTYPRSAASKMRSKRLRFSANVYSASATRSCGRE